MKPTLVYTADGSHSIYLPDLNEHYHSVHGAIQESMHVFIQAGLHAVSIDPINLLEVGLGTGLNALLTLLENKKKPRKIHYTSLEKFPLPAEIYQSLNYAKLLNVDAQEFLKIHESDWEVPVVFNEHFQFTKHHNSLQQWKTTQQFQLIYFDAFAPEKQPDMWTEEIFFKIFELLESGGIMVTYCAKGVVKRTLKSCGFEVQTLPGPPGKREMIRVVKPKGTIL
ncbi:MAG: tRNA (5-methylaminomethyl-2-thiouridine)(34)-methyltransferase MnmD [Flavobacteriales bacterium]|nr:tRNA (5-methylaminomethyl-2-thiouridine)(34)-methyltransferase MnmD [Flavobacteriales bacterium]